MAPGKFTPQTRQVVELALAGKKNNEICYITGLPSMTVSDIVNRYTKQVRVLIKPLPDDQLSLNLGDPNA